MDTNNKTLEMFPFQQENITYEIVPDMYDAQYYSGVYQRPKTTIKHCFSNRFIRCSSADTATEAEVLMSGMLVLNQAWEQFDRKLYGFEFNTKSPYENYDNMECRFFDFSVKKQTTGLVVEIHTYHSITNTYNESIDSRYGLFSNRQYHNITANEDMKDDSYHKELNEDIMRHFLKSYSILDFKIIYTLDKKFENPELLYN
jgi:hypothetical protein